MRRTQCIRFGISIQDLIRVLLSGARNTKSKVKKYMLCMGQQTNSPHLITLFVVLPSL